VIPRDPQIEAAVLPVKKSVAAARCTSCHIPVLPLTNNGWFYSEPIRFQSEGTYAWRCSTGLRRPDKSGVAFAAINSR